MDHWFGPAGLFSCSYVLHLTPTVILFCLFWGYAWPLLLATGFPWGGWEWHWEAVADLVGRDCLGVPLRSTVSCLCPIGGCCWGYRGLWCACYAICALQVGMDCYFPDQNVHGMQEVRSGRVSLPTPFQCWHFGTHQFVLPARREKYSGSDPKLHKWRSMHTAGLYPQSHKIQNEIRSGPVCGKEQLSS